MLPNWFRMTIAGVLAGALIWVLIADSLSKEFEAQAVELVLAGALAAMIANQRGGKDD